MFKKIFILINLNTRISLYFKNIIIHEIMIYIKLLVTVFVKNNFIFTTLKATYVRRTK